MSARDHVAGRGLSACFREHHAFVHGVVCDRCGDPVLAEEITAQTFEAALPTSSPGAAALTSHRPGSRSLRSVGWWITGATWRRVREYSTASQAAISSASFEPSDDLDDDVTGALESLPTRQRTVLTRR